MNDDIKFMNLIIDDYQTGLFDFPIFYSTSSINRLNQLIRSID